MTEWNGNAIKLAANRWSVTGVT